MSRFIQQHIICVTTQYPHIFTPRKLLYNVIFTLLLFTSLLILALFRKVIYCNLCHSFTFQPFSFSVADLEITSILLIYNREYFCQPPCTNSHTVDCAVYSSSFLDLPGWPCNFFFLHSPSFSVKKKLHGCPGRSRNELLYTTLVCQ